MKMKKEYIEELGKEVKKTNKMLKNMILSFEHDSYHITIFLKRNQQRPKPIFKVKKYLLVIAVRFLRKIQKKKIKL